jgi:hypothetical protein
MLPCAYKLQVCLHGSGGLPFRAEWCMSQRRLAAATGTPASLHVALTASSAAKKDGFQYLSRYMVLDASNRVPADVALVPAPRRHGDSLRQSVCIAPTSSLECAAGEVLAIASEMAADAAAAANAATRFFWEQCSVSAVIGSVGVRAVQPAEG